MTGEKKYLSRHAGTRKRRLSAFLGSFARETDGNMSIFAIAGATLMMVFGGVGIDMIHAEVQRNRLQATLDRAVLAAADLEQRLEPQFVVNDYFDKMLMSDALASVTIEEGLNYRSVNASAQRIFPANFLEMLGVENLQASGVSAAEERISNIEISMVLDISGSMGSNQKIENLRDAAKEFVNTVIDNDDAGLTTISIVPYNATVNLGPTVSQYFNLSDEHDVSACAIFPDTAFHSLGISPTQELQRLSHFDPYTMNQDTVVTPSSWCPTDEYGEIIVHSDDRQELIGHIDSLGAGGNTAIDVGMKWGLALLDPAARPAIANMIGDGRITSEANGRPANYDADDALKIVVVMTDGMNTTQYDLRDEFKDGWSNIYIDDRGDNDPWNDRFSHKVRNYSGSSNDVYYWERYESSNWNTRYRNYPDGGGDARRMTNAEVFARWGTRAHAQKFYRKPYYDGWVSYNDYYYAYYAYESIVNGSQADSRLSTICNAARNAQVTVFAIGFEAPDEGQAAMRDCASSPSHYFPVEGVEITDAFQAIARTINQLRLTQ